MPIDSQSIAREIEAEVRSASARSADQAGAQAAGDVAIAGVQEDFCAVWPKAKPILELISGIAIVIPGVGAAAGAVLKVLIKVGDGIYKDVCST